ncbi:hypothetical protein Skr01_04700 [Sphaerisporangium krabiense]|uniref:WXG100 family type VII secretion target n=1 Tax=Sphaerisporangium krabiense TaxID=763782 RepID=A0A7W8Z790_9ACTN|nr:hypothetical protein [Sphaerisporangium krabiense]MBB5628773.1 hypothetical protein [Sphaerisporangium krabiense]GII60385.1 hypothetical protein Skr01_04700 [Sphaerisporangium krabiense]
MGQEKYVTSAAIESIIKEIDQDVVPAVREWRGLVDTTTVGFPGWGALGELIIGLRYRQVQDDVRGKLAEAVTVLETWTRQLDTARANWRAAEDASTAVYV